MILLTPPVKRYSSGMFIELAFSVAARLNPDILIIDEVLAVGDADFQRKCIQKIDSQTKCGRTVLIVSHNLSLVASLCNKVILLDKGKIVRYGNTDQCISDYLNLSKTSINPSDDSSNYVQNLTVNGKILNQDNMILNIKDEFTHLDSNYRIYRTTKYYCFIFFYRKRTKDGISCNSPKL